MLKRIRLLVFALLVLQQALMFFSCRMTDEHPFTDKSSGEETKHIHMLQELNSLILPIRASPLGLTDSELDFLNRLEEAKIVALGEATHGTKEFFQMKHRIFQYLVEHCNHKAFGFEADFAESLFLDQYICTGEGNLRELMKKKMHFWTWKTEEVLQLLEWMKDYNGDKCEEEKIHYYGFDCQFTTYQADFLKDYFQQTIPDLWDIAEPVLSQVQDISDNDYKNISPETYNIIKSQLESLENQLMARMKILVNKSSLKQFEIHKQLLNTFKQAFIVNYHTAIKDFSINRRDQFMAENSTWILNFLGPDTRISLWAHNAHIAKDPDYGSMGFYLKEKFNRLYQILGFGFSMGTFTAVGVNSSGTYTGLRTHTIIRSPRNDSINFLFHNSMDDNFVLLLDTILTDYKLYDWLNSPRPFLSIGAVFNGNSNNYYKNLNIMELFNWIIYFDETEASSLLY